MNRITKTLWFEVENNADQHTIDNIVRTASHPLTSSFENLIDLYITVVYISIYNYMLLYNQHKEMLGLEYGMEHGKDTLQKILQFKKQLTIEPECVIDNYVIPECFFRNYLTDSLRDSLFEGLRVDHRVVALTETLIRDDRVVKLFNIEREELQSIVAFAISQDIAQTKKNQLDKINSVDANTSTWRDKISMNGILQCFTLNDDQLSLFKSLCCVGCNTFSEFQTRVHIQAYKRAHPDI